jgi:hypothetical protein
MDQDAHDEDVQYDDEGIQPGGVVGSMKDLQGDVDTARQRAQISPHTLPNHRPAASMKRIAM